MWVFDCGEPLSLETVNETLGQLREQRDAKNLGSKMAGTDEIADTELLTA